MVTGDTRPTRQRRSKQREIILEELKKLKTHPRSDELYSIVRRRLPNVSLGTVYRNLNELQQEGMALEIYCGDFVRYDGDVMPHDHFLCRICRKVWDFDPNPEAQENVPSEAVEANGFQIDGHYTIFFGSCPECRAKPKHEVD